MQVPVSEAKAQSTELVRRAEAGDEVILTRHGNPTVRLVPIQARPDADADARRAVIAALQAAVELLLLLFRGVPNKEVGKTIKPQQAERGLSFPRRQEVSRENQWKCYFLLYC